MAYLLGVYLTDGSISSENKFQLQVIDREFADFTLECIKKIKPDCKSSVYVRDATNSGWNKQIQYCINPGFTRFKNFFEIQTGKKHHIPFIIWDAPLVIKKWFIAGIMDGDGWVAYHTSQNRVQWTMGIGKVEKGWIYEFKELLEKLQIKIYKPHRRITKNGIPFVSFNINIEDFISRGLFFTINRKQQRLLKIIERRSETMRCTPPGEMK
jgi:intein/homing endonuclease